MPGAVHDHGRHVGGDLLHGVDLDEAEAHALAFGDQEAYTCYKSLCSIVITPDEESAMTFRVPAPLDTYVEATNNQDAETLVALFAEDAVVRDEGQEYRGLDGVRAWRAKTEQAYTYTVEPKSVAERGGLTVLTAKVEGSFPGSPVELDFDFRLRDGRIAGLAIHS